jgi:hypothetical protein
VISVEDLIDILESLFPGLEVVGETEPGKTKEPIEVARELVAVVFERPDVVESSDWTDLMLLIEVLLDKGAASPWDTFAESFLEDLLNAVSHRELSVTREQVDECLGPASRQLADYFDRVWVSMPDDEGPNVMDPVKFDRIGDSDLRWIIRCMFRRTSEDKYVGTADIVRREAQTGRPGGVAP